MAESTPYVLLAGGLVYADRLLNEGKLDIGVSVGTVVAAIVTGGIELISPGLGKGFGVLLLLGAVLTSGPAVIKALQGQ